MIGKIIGAIAGSKVADHTRGMSGPFGAAAGMVTATALRRMSIPALLALTAGGYIAKKVMDRKRDEKPVNSPVNKTAPPPLADRVGA